MTRDEAWNEKKCKEILEALEQESCDDLISRQAAIDCVTYDEEYTVECLKELPPVTPPTNIGWWIDEKVDGGRKVYCSKCNGSAVFEHVNDGDIYSSYGHGVVKKTKYCPNCGTRMREVNG